MPIRCKMKLTEIRDYGSSRTLVFMPEYDTRIPEDQRFALNTPSGRLEMGLNNKNLFGSFVVGQFYYLDLTPAPTPITDTLTQKLHPNMRGVCEVMETTDPKT